MTSYMLDEPRAHLKAQPYQTLAKPLFLLLNQKATRCYRAVFLWRTAKNQQGFLAMHRAFSL